MLAFGFGLCLRLDTVAPLGASGFDEHRECCNGFGWRAVVGEFGGHVAEVVHSNPQIAETSASTTVADQMMISPALTSLTL